MRILKLGLVKAAVAVLALFPASALAQAGGGFDLSWSTIDGGGGMFSTGGGYRVGGTAGQPDAGASSGGSYALSGGFWYAGRGTTGIESPALAAPLAFRLHAAPNPFRGATHIAFDLPAPQRVRLSIYNLGGKLVRALLDEEKEAGRYETAWDGTDGTGRETARGVYFLNIETEVFRAARKLILLRN